MSIRNTRECRAFSIWEQNFHQLLKLKPHKLKLRLHEYMRWIQGSVPSSLHLSACISGAFEKTKILHIWTHIIWIGYHAQHIELCGKFDAVCFKNYLLRSLRMGSTQNIRCFFLVTWIVSIASSAWFLQKIFLLFFISLNARIFNLEERAYKAFHKLY